MNDSAPQPAAGLSKRLLNSALYNVIGNVLSVLVSLMIMPYVVHELGDYLYGVFSLAMVIVGYFAILDFGFGIAVIKYLSERRDGGDAASVNRTVGTALTANIVAGSAGAAAMFFGAGFLAAHFFKSAGAAGALPANAIFAIRIASVIFLLNMVSAVFLAIPQSQHRFDLLNIMRTITKIAQTVGIAAVLAAGGSLPQVLYLYAAVTFVSFFYYYYTSRRIMPRGCSMLPRFDLKSFRMLFSFGFFTTVGKIAALLLFQFDRLIIGALLSAESVTYYVVPGVLAGMISLAAANIAPVLMPAASELDSSGAPEKLRALYTKSVKYCYILTLPFFVTLSAMPYQILLYWQNEKFARNSSLVLVFLAAGWVIQALSAVPTMIIVGVGRPDIQAYCLSAAAALDVALCFFLVPRFGIAGAAGAFALTSVISVIPFFIYIGLRMKFNPFGIIRESLLSPTLAAALSFGSIRLMKSYVSGIPGLIAVAGAGGIVFIVGLLATKAVGRAELDIVKSYLKR
jgi:O-antigen/teichoic acid export membrane protein